MVTYMGGAMPGKFVVKKGPTGKFRFSLLSTNGQVVAASEAYETKRAALSGVAAVQEARGRREDRRYDGCRGGVEAGAREVRRKEAGGQEAGGEEAGQEAGRQEEVGTGPGRRGRPRLPGMAPQLHGGARAGALYASSSLRIPRTACPMRCSFSTSAKRTKPSPPGPNPTPGDTATLASCTQHRGELEAPSSA